MLHGNAYVVHNYRQWYFWYCVCNVLARVTVFCDHTLVKSSIILLFTRHTQLHTSRKCYYGD